MEGKRKKAYFWLGNKENPYILEKLDEDSLLTMIRNLNVEIDVIVLSTCHSKHLGATLLKCGEPSPVVIAINSTDMLLQNAAFVFNKEFLLSLCKHERSI
jgi:hypothetical protein